MCVILKKQSRLLRKCIYLQKLKRTRHIHSEVSSSGKTNIAVNQQRTPLESFTDRISKLYDVASCKTALRYSKVLHTFQQKASVFSVDAENKITIADEKTRKKQIPKLKNQNILLESQQIIENITTACHSNDVNSKISCIKTLSDYLQRHPDEKHTFIKKDVIGKVLRIRRQISAEEEQGTIRQVLVQLGHTNPLPSKGIRVLSIDGGGVRGILVIEMLKKLEELTGKRVFELFDFVCGVSTGAILTCLLVAQQMSLDELSKKYKEMSAQIFCQSTLQGTKNLVLSHSYYDTSVWENILKSTFGEDILIHSARIRGCPKLCAVSAVVNQSQLSAYLFRNYALPWKVQSQYQGSYNHAIWEAVRASAAAPTYFEEFKLGNLLHQDGGILINNPTAVAIHEAKLLWPHSPIQCVVSFGTGRSTPNPNDVKGESIFTKTSSWKNKFMKIVESATDTEGVHIMLADLLPQNTYFRFNPYLTEKCSIEETDPKKLEQMESDTIMYLRRNDDKFKEAAQKLKEPKYIYNRLSDWVSTKGILLGASMFSC